jgi:hypothetical protein
MRKKSNPLPQNLHAPRFRQLADEACLSFLKEVGEMRGIGALFADEAGDTLSELDQWRKVINILVDGPADWFVGCRFYPSTTSSSEDMIVCLCDLKTHEQTNYHLTQKTDLVYSICLSRIPTHSNLAAVKDLYRWLYDFYAKRKNYDGFGNDAWSLYRRISDKYSSQAKRLRDDAISIVDAAAKSYLADQEGQTGLLRGNGETDNSNETAKPVSNIGITAKVKGKAGETGVADQPEQTTGTNKVEIKKADLPNEAFRAYYLVVCEGKKQWEAAKIIEDERRRPTNQGQVSRWIKKVNDSFPTGLDINLFKGKTFSWDNSTIDLGQRQDGRNPPRNNEDDTE